MAFDFKKEISALNETRQNDRIAAERLRAVPQRAPSAVEILSYAFLPLLFIMIGAMPMSGFILMPFTLPMLYLMFRRFGFFPPFFCIVFYGLLSLLFNYDILSVFYICFLAFGFFGLVGAMQTKPYLLCALLVSLCCFSGVLVGAGIVRLAEKKPIGEVAAEYVLSEREDPFLRVILEYFYEHDDVPEDMGKVEKDNPEYSLKAAEYAAKFIADDMKLYLPYYCLHFGAVYGAVGYFFAIFLNGRTCSPYDVGANEDNVKRSVRSLGGILPEKRRIEHMTLPRSFLWVCLLPAFVVTLILEFVGDFDPLSSFIMHAFVTLPGAFGFFTLLCYFSSLFSGKTKIAANIFFGIIAAVAVYIPVVLFFCSMVGICDSILNLRYWTRFLTEEDK